MTPSLGQMRRFRLAVIAAVATLAALSVVVVLLPPGVPSDVLKDGGQAAGAIAALVACWWLARQSVGRSRWAWGLLAAAAAASTLAEIAEGVFSAATVSTPGLFDVSDVGTTWTMPLAIVGLLFFPTQETRQGTLRWAGLDAAMIALSLIFVGSALSLPELFVRLSPAHAWLGLASLTIDLTLLTVISLTLRRSQSRRRPRVLFALAGLAVIAAADCASVFLSSTSGLTALRELLGSGSMYGFAIVALGALWPELSPDPTSADDIPIWPDLVPYVGVGAVAAAGITTSLQGRSMTGYAAAAAGGVAAVLVASHLLSSSEARTMLRQRRIVEERLRQRENLLNEVIDHAPQGVAAIGADHRITNVNPGLASMLYAPVAVLVGATMDTFLPADYLNRVFKGVEQSGGTYEADCQAKRADGSQLWVHLSVTAIRRPDAADHYFLATFEDVTAKREAEELAVANLAQLEKLNRLKSEFVSMVSHEFRTALVGIQGFSELIRDQEMDAREVKTLAEEINNDAQRLNRMITEMLDFDRLEAGKLHLDLRPLDMNELVVAAVEHAAVTTQDHSVAAQVQPGLPPVLGDSDRLTQVLTNLLSNAIKYSPDGGDISVRTRLLSGAVEVSVTDHGRGIPPEFISRLFGRYERYEDKHAGKIIGTGLGLAITRQIVEMHGGRIAVDSVVGRGSEFRFTVPLASTAAAVATRSA